jgi:hypothetical protein
MSAVIDREPELAGMPAAVQTPALPAGVLIEVCAIGHPVEPVTVRTRRAAAGEESICLEVLLDQRCAGHPHALPLLVRCFIADRGGWDATYQHAASKALQLNAGGQLAAIGCGIETGRLPKNRERANASSAPECLRLIYCIRLEPAVVLFPPSEFERAH